MNQSAARVLHACETWMCTAFACAVFVASAPAAQAGINVWTSHGPPGGVVTGIVTAVAIDPTTPTTLYAVIGGGVFDIEQVAAVPCAGDCNNDQAVTIDELFTIVNIALAKPGSCPSGVPAGATVDVSLIITAVNHALSGSDG